MLKRLSLILLALCMLLGCFACARKEDGDKQDVTTEAPKTGPSEFAAWTTHSYNKIITNVGPGDDLSTDYTVYLAKGETEGCTVAVYSDIELKGCTFKCVSGNTETIELSSYSMNRSHKVGRKQYTDSLIPYYGRKLNLEAETALPFMVEFKTNENTPAGDHEYVYEFANKDGEVLATFNITVHVWDITLPEEKTFVTAMGLSSGWIGVSAGGVDDEIYRQWYDIHLEHNMSSYDIPYGILSDKADEYMSNPKVTSFRVPVPMYADGTINKNLVLQYYNKLKTNPVWLEKAYFYPLDEPRTLEHLKELRAFEEQLTALCPEIEICAPYYTNIKVGTEKDQTADMADYTDLWCPKLCLWDDKKSYDEFLDYKPSKSFEDRMLEEQAKGDRVWCYVCNDPDDPYAQMFVDTEGVNQRLMFWQMYQRDIEGFLYWGTNYYGYKEGPNYEGNATPQDPWETVNTKIPNGDGQTIYGCGLLFYPGKKVGIPNCCPSIRAKIIRDGVDDIELFYLAEDILGKDWLVNKTKEGTSSLTSYTDADSFAALRIEIGNALEAAMK